MERTFRDDVHQRRLEEDGYTTFSYLTPEELAELRKLAEAARTGEFAEYLHFHISAVSQDREYRDWMAREIRRIVSPAVDRVFVDHEVDFRAYAASLLVKLPHDPESTLLAHVDPAFVDEARHVACTVWSPLYDTTVESGTIHVGSGSKWVVPTARGQSLTPPLDMEAQPDLMAHSIPLPLRAGEAAAWDQRTIHWSPPNFSPEPRVAISTVVVPRRAQPIHFAVTEDGVARRYEVDESFASATPRDIPRSAGIPIGPEHPRVSTADVIAAFGNGGGRVRRLARGLRRRRLARALSQG